MARFPRQAEAGSRADDRGRVVLSFSEKIDGTSADRADLVLPRRFV